MEKNKYINTAEKKVKNLLSELYDSKSAALKAKKAAEQRYNKRVAELDEEIEKLDNKKGLLEKNFEELKKEGSENWDVIQSDFESVMTSIEEDKDTYVNKAENILDNMDEKMKDIEDKIDNAGEETKTELKEIYEGLKVDRESLGDIINKAKKDTSDTWKDIKSWFSQKSATINEL